MAIIVTTNDIIIELKSIFTARENISVLADFPMAVTALCDNGIPNSMANIAMNHCSKVTIESTYFSLIPSTISEESSRFLSDSIIT